ncbi:transcription initiation factor IIA, gamma subunit [Pyronema omphalodes]|nr:transcription initiation factor IIA, gamma subunit [Pyronema omphalodes]
MDHDVPFLAIYRGSSIGRTLIDAIDVLIMEGRMNPQIAYRVLVNFDRHVALALKDQVKEVIKFKGDLVTYRFVDNVWNVVLKNVQFILPQKEIIMAQNIQIVATRSHMDYYQDFVKEEKNKER